MRAKLWPLLCSGMKFQGIRPNLGDPSAKLLLKGPAREHFHCGGHCRNHGMVWVRRDLKDHPVPRWNQFSPVMICEQECEG